MTTKEHSEPWVIFGTSPFISKIYDKIPEICATHNSIGLNLFPTAFAGVDFWLFNDAGIFRRCYNGGYFRPEHKLIVGKNRVSELKSKYANSRCVIGNSFLVTPHYIFDYAYDEPVLEENGKLLFLFSVVLPALNYALLQGVKDVVLAGIDLNPEWGRFNASPTKKAQWQIDVIKDKLELFRPHLNIFKANKDAAIDFEAYKF